MSVTLPSAVATRKMPHVALLIETSRSYTRDLLRGIRRYMAAHGPWSIFLEQRALESRVPPWLTHWRGDGILTRTGTQAMANAIARTDVPAIELRATKLRHRLPFVGVDNHAVGATVASHLIERGFEHFGLFALDTELFFEERCDNFIRALHLRGLKCAIFKAEGAREKPLQWEQQQSKLAKWIRGLPKPVGLMACTDQLGFWLLDACKRADVAVPEQAAVVGVENDESLCEMSTPPLSSVRFDAEKTGFAAAALLDQMMAGQEIPPSQTLIEPIGIITRQSSDVIAMADPLVADAVRLIRENACDNLNVEGVLDSLLVSRSTLERRMIAALGHTPKEEILRVRMRRVREMLTETTLPLKIIAVRTGFRHAQYLGEVFRKQTGMTPGQFRTKHQR